VATFVLCEAGCQRNLSWEIDQIMAWTCARGSTS
jgi:hypothetical protein